MTRHPRPITGTHLFQRERCRRFVWLEFHGDHAQKLPPDAAMQMRLRRGRVHEREIVAKLDVVEPRYPARDFEAGAAATKQLIDSGAPCIYQGVLAAPGRVGMPDLLRRSGERDYIVGDVKAAAAPKIEHAMQVAFYTDLLATATGRPRAERAFLLLSGGEEVEVRLADVDRIYRESISDVESMRSGAAEPRATQNIHCSGCAWRGVCLPALSRAGDLSLVFGITPARRAALESEGVADLRAMARIDPAALADRTEIPRETLRRLSLQAQALVRQKPVRVGVPSWKPARIALAASVARDPRGTHFAEFFIYKTTKWNGQLEESWFHQEAREPAGEAVAYRRMLDALAADRDAPIYHYGSELPDALAALDSRHGKLRDPIAAVFARLSDVQTSIRSALALPVYHYDLDSVARALGVAPWTADAPADGAPEDQLLAAMRRQTAHEVKAIRSIRVAAQRAWETAGAEPAPAPMPTDASAGAAAP